MPIIVEKLGEGELEEKYKNIKLDKLVSKRDFIIKDLDDEEFEKISCPPPPDSKLGITDKLNQLKEEFEHLYEHNKKRNETIKRLIALLN